MPNHDSELNNSDVMYPAVTNNSESSHAMIPAQPMAAMPAMPPMGMGFSQGPEILSGSFNQTWLLNCLRRRWLAALLLGLIAAVLSAIVLLILFPLSSSVTSYLEVKATGTTTWDGKTKTIPHKERELFQETQKTLLKSQFVLKAALHPNAIAQLDVVRKKGRNVMNWLIEDVMATFHGEILEVKYEGEEDPEQMKKVIDGIIDAYIEEVANTKRIEQVDVIDKLKELHADTSRDLQEKFEEYNELAEELEGAESEIASQMLNMLIGEVRVINKDINIVKKELLNIEVERQMAETIARSASALDQAVQAELAKDPLLLNYQNNLYAIEEQIRSLESTTKGGGSAQIKRLYEQKQKLTQDMQDYEYDKKSELTNQLKNAPNDSLRMAMINYVTRRDHLNNTLAELEAQREEKERQIQQRGQKSGKLAILKSEIDQLSEMEQIMDMRIRGADIEKIASVDNIRVMQRASAESQINSFQRYMIAALGGIGAFVATCYLVALVEFRKRRLNAPIDVDEGLGIRVLGSLPPLTRKSAGGLAAVQLSESIDNVRATLMHDSTSRGRQVILVTSPGTLEGNTTVASHLALSFARAGRRTLLIDGDLREPALHKLFGMPTEDGLSEVLRSELDVSDAVRPTTTEGLWLLPAGQCDMDAIHGLATDQLQPIFEKLRDEFDYVIIDAPPVLGLADTLSMGQHADGVILTVLRDQSEVRKIHQAAELLRRLGVRLLGSVVNGVPQKADRRVVRLHRNQAAKPKKLADEAKQSKPSKVEEPTPEPAPTAAAPSASDIDLDLDDLDFDELK